MAALPPATAHWQDAPSSEGGTHSPALARLATLAARVEGPVGIEMRAILSPLSAELNSEQKRLEELSIAQADALVNSAMMMSELQESRAELERARQVAEAASRSKSEFLANMSHEIRTPINGVLGMNEILMRSELTPKQHRCVVTIRNSIDALLRVINDILDFSKIESGKLELHDSPFDLRDVVEDLVGLYAESAYQRGVELKAVLPVSMPTRLIGDDGRLRQILTNLVGNALKFTSSGEVVINVKVEHEHEDGRVVMRFDVQDTGIGIAPAARAHIFDAFTQADGTTQRRYGGTGLGLAIASQLACYMGGQIVVESELDKGSTFWFTVCMRRDSAKYPEDETPDALRGMRVLAVDDNETNRAIYHDQLGHWGCIFEMAFDGENALERLQLAARAGQPFELVILDMHMPGMDGLELARRIVDDHTIPTPIQIMLSSMSDQLSTDQYRENGITQYLTKPARHLDLYRCLRRVRCGEPAPAQAAPSAPTSVPHVRGRILVAEDNLVNQEVILDLLSIDGLEVEIAADGLQAVNALNARRYDLVFMDCQMPVMDGFLATATIRSMEKERGGGHVPIVALTANALEGDRERCLAAGMDDYLSKPFKAEELYARLSRWLPPAHDVEIDAPEPAAACMVPAPISAADTTSAATNAQLLNPEALAHFEAREKSGRAGVLKRVVCAYQEQSAAIVQQMGASLAQGHFEAVRNGAHALKSSSAVVGAEMLSTLCREIEEACRNGNERLAVELVPDAIAMFAGVQRSLRERYPGLCL